MKLLQEQAMEISRMKGNIFDIRRFSTHDGVGIRTTIFLKGCPLACVWCQNPEGISVKKRPLHFENRCIQCGTCVALCKNRGFQKKADKIVIDPTAEENWDQLIYECPAGAIEMDSQEKTVEDIMTEIRKDAVFYQYGGGVTLSGGEPLLQSRFSQELLKCCKEEGIHTAVESALYVPQGTLDMVIPYLDMAYADMKLIDDGMHQKYVGVSNQKIKENIKYLLTSSIKENVIIRTPMIPGITATKENIQGIGAFISTIYPDVHYEILNYNPLAEAKYHLIDKEYCFEENPKLYTKEEMEQFGCWAKEAGVKNIIIES